MSLPLTSCVTLTKSLNLSGTVSSFQTGNIGMDNCAFFSRANTLGFQSVLSKLPRALRMIEIPRRITRTRPSMVSRGLQRHHPIHQLFLPSSTFLPGIPLLLSLPVLLLSSPPHIPHWNQSEKNFRYVFFLTHKH